jgi:hypothetical protein
VSVEDGKGCVTAVSPGTAIITAAATDGSGKYDSCTVTVSAANTQNVEAFINAGITHLKNGYYDNAVKSFEDAFNADQPNSATYTKSVVYSSLVKLASIMKDENFRNLLSRRFGLTGYPDNLDDLLDKDEIQSGYINDWDDIGDIFSSGWLETYTSQDLKGSYFDPSIEQWVKWYNDWEIGSFEYFELNPVSGYYYWDYLDSTYHLVSTEPRYRTELLPGLAVPGWFDTTDAYKDTLTQSGLKSPGTWELLLLANLVDKNTSGLNGLLDGVLSSVFGQTFEDAADRAQLIGYGDSFTVDEDVLKALSLWGAFEGDVDLGRVELDLLFSAFRVLKASLEWISSYDWDTDVSFLKTEWKDLEDRIDQLEPANLPFRNNFLKDRGNGGMNRSKADYIEAIETAIAAYDSMIDNTGHLPPAAIEKLNELRWLKDGLAQLKAAISNGGTFYVKEGSGASYSNTQYGAEFGVDLGKFFTPGQLAIDKLITTETGGNTPQFFGMQDEDSGVFINNQNQFNGYEMIGFEFNTTPLQQVFVYGFDFPNDSTYIPMFPRDLAEHLYDLYH